MNRITKFITSGCFFGYSPLAPGTAGSALMALIYWLIPLENQWIWFSFAVGFFFLGVYLSHRAEQFWGEDASRIVIDEMVGFLTAVLFLPKSFLAVISAFFIFRFLDITKPLPAGRLQKLPGGWGVMADDLIVGVYTNLLIRAVIFLIK